MRIDRAVHAFADFSLQGDATNVRSIGAAHRQHIRTRDHGEFGRHAVGIFRLSFGPVKSDAECGAAGAAIKTGMVHPCMIAQTKKRRASDTPFIEPI